MEKGGVDVNPMIKSASDKRGFTTGIQITMLRRRGPSDLI
jgi:hypothetical protein